MIINPQEEVRRIAHDLPGNLKLQRECGILTCEDDLPFATLADIPCLDGQQYFALESGQRAPIVFGSLDDQLANTIVGITRKLITELIAEEATKARNLKDEKLLGLYQKIDSELNIAVAMYYMATKPFKIFGLEGDELRVVWSMLQLEQYKRIANLISQVDFLKNESIAQMNVARRLIEGY